MQAIQTTYNGYRFRSRCEARWAVFFDAMGIEYQYEKEGFNLPSGNYLPDFWLPGVSMFAEVKPEKFSDEEFNKCVELANASAHPVLMLEGPPENRGYRAVEPKPFYESWYALTSIYLDEKRFFSGADEDTQFDDVKRGVEISRSARFEFGESGPPRPKPPPRPAPMSPRYEAALLKQSARVERIRAHLEGSPEQTEEFCRLIEEIRKEDLSKTGPMLKQKPR